MRPAGWFLGLDYYVGFLRLMVFFLLAYYKQFCIFLVPTNSEISNHFIDSDN